MGPQKEAFSLLFQFIPSTRVSIISSDLIIKRDGITINLTLTSDIPEKSAFYIFCHDIEAIHEEYLSKKVEFTESLNATDYGMREFVVVDPDKNKLIFGQGK